MHLDERQKQRESRDTETDRLHVGDSGLAMMNSATYTSCVITSTLCAFVMFSPPWNRDNYKNPPQRRCEDPVANAESNAGQTRYFVSVSTDTFGWGRDWETRSSYTLGEQVALTMGKPEKNTRVKVALGRLLGCSPFRIKQQESNSAALFW